MITRGLAEHVSPTLHTEPVDIQHLDEEHFHFQVSDPPRVVLILLRIKKRAMHMRSFHVSVPQNCE